MKHQDIFQQMVEKWPSPFVAQAEFHRFTGGLISGKTLANLRSRGESVPESVKVGSRRAYVAQSSAVWLRQRANEAEVA
jgi:hypothetical protein